MECQNTFKTAWLIVRDIQAKNVSETTRDLEHRLLSHDVIVHTPADETMAIYDTTARIEGQVGRQESLPATSAMILANQITRLPPLNTNASLEVFKINKPPFYCPFTYDLSAPALWTFVTLYGNSRA